MKFIFDCPDHNRAFESSEFSVIENQGVVADKTNGRVLDAKVALDEPCPFCGKKHVYHASELFCPFAAWNDD